MTAVTVIFLTLNIFLFILFSSEKFNRSEKENVPIAPRRQHRSYFASFPFRTLTVGTGISPVRRKSFAFADYTAGMEFHQSPKI